jgi:MFS superfamily sulfate permease-like transporter
VLGRVGTHDFVSVARFAQAQRAPGVLVLRPEEPLFFANADPLLAAARQLVLQQADARLVVFSLEESPDLDGTALEAFGEFAQWLAARGIEMRVARLKEAARDALLRACFGALPLSGLDYSSVDDAVSGKSEGPPGRAT